MNSSRFSQALLKATESFSVSLTHSLLCGVVVMTSDWELVGSEFKYRKFFFFRKEKSSLISLILNTKSEKHNYVNFSVHTIAKTETQTIIELLSSCKS